MNQKQRKQRWSLTLLYAGVFFVIQLIAVLITAALSFLLSKLGVLENFGFPDNSTLALLTVMLLVSVAVGILITIFTMKIPLNPFNRLINNMNRLAGGDYSARLTYGKLLQKNPAFRELSDSFNAMAEELENTQMLRSDFVNNFSHEFKTPIVSIAGFAKLLRRGNLTEEQKQEYLAIIEEESLRLAAMATNVMSLTRIENQTILTDLTTFNLSEQLRGCVLLLEEKWSRKELDLDLEFPECTIRANEEMLKQVWINLLDNAIRYSPSHGEIRVRIAEAPDTLAVTVTNYGPDIPADKIGKIWGKFYQADESHSSEGNGIGLAVVKRVVQLHGGSASVTSGNGATAFTVTLPKRA
ncbi:MAG: HAMP domain-containing sensor histidine kinase [Firmicutes bacterium]|nr:HAMP domain-containing sensor histidine kinase [Bacillota bacterium]